MKKLFGVICLSSFLVANNLPEKNETEEQLALSAAGIGDIYMPTAQSLSNAAHNATMDELLNNSSSDMGYTILNGSK